MLRERNRHKKYMNLKSILKYYLVGCSLVIATNLKAKDLPLKKNAQRPVRPIAIEKTVVQKQQDSRFGVGLNIGSNAMFGNSLTIHYDLLPLVELRGGLGYNMSGGKAGFGGGVKIPLGMFGVIAGSGFVRSSSTSDKVRIPAKFTPAGSSISEEITAMRAYRISPSTYSTTYVGAFMDWAPQFRLALEVNWNTVTAGNEVTLSGETEFDQPIEVTNEDDMLPEFNTAARKKLDINGLGISVGLQIRL